MPCKIHYISQLLTILLVIILGLCIIASPALANSAEPPAIFIIVPNAPADLELTINKLPGSIENLPFEKRFSFYRHLSDMFSRDNIKIEVSTGGRTTELNLGTLPARYNNIYTLDLDSMTLTSGKSLARSFRLISLRLILTLLIEGLIFFLMGYRRKKSWLIFLIINLVTQGGLNIWLNTMAPEQYYILFTLILGEFFVFVFEMTAFLIVLNEHRRWRTALFVIAGNLVSLIAGGFAITLLPL